MINSAIATSKVCVIIVSYNFEPWIYKCLNSLRSSTLKLNIVVVDNSSQDKTCEIIKNEFPEITLFENKQNLGFGKANNIGIEYAIKNGFDYVFLLNQDAWIEADAMDSLLEAAVKHKEYGILSPIHLNGKGADFDKGFANYLSLNSLEDVKNTKTQIINTKFVNAAMWLIPLSVIKETGGFAPLFSHYGEDVNLAQRIRKNGYKIGVITSAIGYHDREFREVSREKYFYSEFVYFLTEATNPFYSSLQAFGYSLLAAKKKALKSLMKGDFNAYRNYFSICFKLMQKWRKIIHTRKIGKQKGMHFLQH